MKHGNSKSSGVALALKCAILLLCFAGPGYCEEYSAALMLEVTPGNGGTLNLPSGVHIYESDAGVTLVATPNPGYRFVYWLGDVTDAMAVTTMVYLDSPKIVIAVFERFDFEFVAGAEMSQASIGGGGLVRSAADYTGGGSGGGGDQPSPPSNPHSTPPPPNPPPVPEPATVVFMISGILGIARYKRRRAGAYSLKL
ncbi:MAG: hypothetical protein ABSG82_04250 [Sedimentisphaerales bacterium]